MAFGAISIFFSLNLMKPYGVSIFPINPAHDVNKKHVNIINIDENPILQQQFDNIISSIKEICDNM